MLKVNWTKCNGFQWRYESLVYIVDVISAQRGKKLERKYFLSKGGQAPRENESNGTQRSIRYLDSFESIIHMYKSMADTCKYNAPLLIKNSQLGHEA